VTWVKDGGFLRYHVLVSVGTCPLGPVSGAPVSFRPYMLLTPSYSRCQVAAFKAGERAHRSRCILTAQA